MRSRTFVTLCVAVWIAAMCLRLGAEPHGERIVQDSFADGVFNGKGEWKTTFVYGGRDPDTIQFDEKTHEGLLAVRYLNSGGDSQGTLIARTDLALVPPQWVKVDVAIPAVEPRGLVRVGVGLISSRDRDPRLGALQRANLIVWGIRSDGLARGHFYGPRGEELGDTPAGASMRAQQYIPGEFFTFLLRRSDATGYELYFSRAGGPWILGRRARLLRTPPSIPGIFFDAGSATHVAVLDNFEVGQDWPIAPPSRRPRAPRVDLPELPRSKHELTLALPEDIYKLPKLEGSRHIVNMPAGRSDEVKGPIPPKAPEGYGGWTYHHGAEIAAFKERIFVAWHATEESEASPVVRAFLAWSKGGEQWSAPIDIASAAGRGNGDEAYLEGFLRRYRRAREQVPYRFDLVPRHFHTQADRLYLWTLASVNGSGDGRVFYTDDGDRWQEIAYGELDRLQFEEGLKIRNNGSNRGFARLSDGRLLAGHLGLRRADGFQFCAPVTHDPTGLSGWHGGWIDTSRCGDVGEPGVYQGPDGALHLTIRGRGSRIWHAFSLDGGHSWSPLTAQSRFSDNPGNKKFGRFPNGWVYYVGNPTGPQRRPVVLAVSKDGWNFDRVCLVRWEPFRSLWPHPKKNGERPGYEYPTATYRDGWLYVAYSHVRDYIEVTKIDLAQIHPSAFRREER